MADTKISALTAATVLDTVDEFVVVDKSDTSMAASGTTKRIPLSVLLADPVFLAAFDARYPPKPSAGVVYGINHYNGVLGVTTTITTTPQALVTIAMPVAPTGSLLDLSMTCYMNSSIGHGSGFLSFQVNGVSPGLTVVVNDSTSLGTWAGHIANVAQPVGTTYNITLMASKSSAGGTLAAQLTNTMLSVVSYRP